VRAEITSVVIHKTQMLEDYKIINQPKTIRFITGATRWWRNHAASFLRFDTIPARDGQTDRRTDGRTDTLRSL